MQDENRRLRAHTKFALEHLIANGYTYYELIEALSINDITKVKSLLVKLCICTIGQVVLKPFKARRDDENSRQ
jgi:hypothetical protein